MLPAPHPAPPLLSIFVGFEAQTFEQGVFSLLASLAMTWQVVESTMTALFRYQHSLSSRLIRTNRRTPLNPMILRLYNTSQQCTSMYVTWGHNQPMGNKWTLKGYFHHALAPAALAYVIIFPYCGSVIYLNVINVNVPNCT